MVNRWLRCLVFVWACSAWAAYAQTAEMPLPKDFAEGESWAWVQVDNRTKVEEGRRTRSVVRVDGVLMFRSERGNSQISNWFLGVPTQSKPWRVWPLAVGQSWEYEEDWRDGDRSGNTQQKATVVGYEEVSVPAGKFGAFKIEYKGWYRTNGRGSGFQNDTYWYAPDVRADIKHVRKDGFNDYTRELVSYEKSKLAQ